MEISNRLNFDYKASKIFNVEIVYKQGKKEIITFKNSSSIRSRPITQSRSFAVCSKAENTSFREKTLPKNVQIREINADAVKEIFGRKNNEFFSSRKRKIENDLVNRDKVLANQIVLLKKLCAFPSLESPKAFNIEKLVLKRKQNFSVKLNKLTSVSRDYRKNSP